MVVKIDDHAEGAKIAASCECGDCGAGLSVAYGGAWGIDGYVIRCRDNPDHTQIARPAELSPSQTPGFNLYRLKGRERELEKTIGTDKARALEKYQGKALLSRDQANEVISLIWPKAPPEEIRRAMLLCVQYGLNPLMKHVFLLKFKKWKDRRVVGEDWVTVRGIGADRLMARRDHNYLYLDLSPRLMSNAEQRKILGEVDPSRIWAITMLRDADTGAEATGIGWWPAKETPYGSDKGNTGLNMARIRSERQGLDRLYPAEMPQGIPVVDDGYLAEPKPGHTEIIEGTVISPVDEKEEKLKLPGQKQKPTGKQPESVEKTTAVDESGGGGRGGAEDAVFSSTRKAETEKKTRPSAPTAARRPEPCCKPLWGLTLLNTKPRPRPM